MKALVKEATPFLANMASMNEKKTSMDGRERVLHIFFLDWKKNAKFDGVARFCIVDPKTMIFTPYDNHALSATMREDPKHLFIAI